MAGFHDSKMTATDGSFCFQRIPPGRYLIAVNTGGPSGTWPYDLQYYPTAMRKEQARIIELAVGQHVTGIDFRLPVLTERSTQVRVTRANGTAVGEASICVAYEGADDYEALAGRNCYARTDQKGLARISTYGRSQVRIYALDYHFSAPRFSPPAQSAADQTADSITLVIGTAKH